MIVGTLLLHSQPTGKRPPVPGGRKRAILPDVRGALQHGRVTGVAREETGIPGERKRRRRWSLKETLESIAALIVIIGFLGATNVGQLRSDLLNKGNSTPTAVAVTSSSSPSPATSAPGGLTQAGSVSASPAPLAIAPQPTFTPVSNTPAGCTQAANTIEVWDTTVRNDLTENNSAAAGLAFRDESAGLYTDASLASNIGVRDDIDRLAVDAYVAGTDLTNGNTAGAEAAVSQQRNDAASFLAICGT
jgi:hypothetical protein